MGETFIVLGETILVLGETICAKLVMGETRYNRSDIKAMMRNSTRAFGGVGQIPKGIFV